MEKYFSSQILSDGKSDSHTKKITVGYSNAVHHRRAFAILAALFWQIMFWRKQLQGLRRKPITSDSFLPLSFQKGISSKANQLPHHSLRFLGLHLWRNNTMEWLKAWPPLSDIWNPLLPLPSTRTRASVFSSGKLSCSLLHSIIMRCKINVCKESSPVSAAQ